jgi:hypothetical protein
MLQQRLWQLDEPAALVPALDGAPARRGAGSALVDAQYRLQRDLVWQASPQARRLAMRVQHRYCPVVFRERERVPRPKAQGELPRQGAPSSFLSPGSIGSNAWAVRRSITMGQLRAVLRICGLVGHPLEQALQRQARRT